MQSALTVHAQADVTEVTATMCLSRSNISVIQIIWLFRHYEYFK